MKILAVTNGANGCDYHRIFNPFRFMPLEDGEIMVFKNTMTESILVNDFEGINLLVFNRHLPMNNSDLIYFKKKYLFKVWVDIDDYWELYTDHYLYKQWKVADTQVRMTNAIKLADIVTCTNAKLAGEISKINENVVVIPNAVPIGHIQFQPQRTESEYIRFLYVGGASHFSDLKSIEDVFKKCREDNHLSNHAQFIMAGVNPKVINNTMSRMESIISVSRHYTPREELNINHYMEHYNHADVAMAPLLNNEFNSMKSNLKVIEAGSMGLPIIASMSQPYMEDKEMHDEGLFLCNSPKDWLEAIKRFVYKPQLIGDMGLKLYDYVSKKYDLIKVNELRRQIINNFKK